MKIETTIAGQPYEVKIPEVPLDYHHVDLSALKKLCQLAADDGEDSMKRLAQNLVDESEVIRQTTLELLDVMRERRMDLCVVYPQLVEALDSVGWGRYVRDFLVRMGSSVTGMMIRSLERGEVKDGQSGIQAQNMIGALARTGDEEAIAFFMRWTQSEDARQRRYAMMFFDDIFRFRPELTTAEMVGVVNKLMNDPDEWVARMAKVARYKHSHNQNAKIPIVKPSMLESEDRAIVFKAVEHLAEREIPVPGTAGGLHKLMLRRDLGDEGERIHDLALNALCKIDPANSLTYLRELVELEQGIHEQGLQVVMMNMEESLPLLAEWMDSPEINLRLAAAVAVEQGLGCFYARKFIPKLWELLKGADERQQCAALSALLKIANEIILLPDVSSEEKLELTRAVWEETRQLLLDTLPVLKTANKKSQAFRTMNMRFQRVIKKL